MLTKLAASLDYLHDGATTTEPLSRDRYDASTSIVLSFFRRRLLTMSYTFRLLCYPVRSAQAVEGLACERWQTSGWCAEGSGQAGEEGDWRAGDFTQGGCDWWAAGKKFT